MWSNGIKGKYMFMFPLQTFSNAFGWMKPFTFWFEFHWPHDPIDDINQYWFSWWFGQHQRATSHYLNHRWPGAVVHLRLTMPEWDRGGLHNSMTGIRWSQTKSKCSESSEQTDLMKWRRTTRAASTTVTGSSPRIFMTLASITGPVDHIERFGYDRN